MLIIKLHISSLDLPFNKPKLVKDICELINNMSKDKISSGSVMLYETLPQLRLSFSAGSSFVLVEVSADKIRGAEYKDFLTKNIRELVTKHLNVPASDISFCFYENADIL